ncbi:hypothetical protein OROGR_018337 [Orobanche gracilis]
MAEQKMHKATEDAQSQTVPMSNSILQKRRIGPQMLTRHDRAEGWELRGTAQEPTITDKIARDPRDRHTGRYMHAVIPLPKAPFRSSHVYRALPPDDSCFTLIP